MSKIYTTQIPVSFSGGTKFRNGDTIMARMLVLAALNYCLKWYFWE